MRVNTGKRPKKGGQTTKNVIAK